jgi:hypothetical protein
MISLSSIIISADQCYVSVFVKGYACSDLFVSVETRILHTYGKGKRTRSEQR